MNIVDVFKLLSDTSRLRIINLLYCQETMCVCELEYILGLSQPNLSKHLNNMKKLDIVTDEKKSKFTFYSLNQEFISKFSFTKELLDKEVKDFEACREDLEKLKEYNESELCCELLSTELVNKNKGEN